MFQVHQKVLKGGLNYSGESMNKKSSCWFKIGDTVRLKKSVAKARGMKDKNETVKISGFYTEVEGGVILDSYIDDFCSWNIEDLELVRWNLMTIAILIQDEYYSAHVETSLPANEAIVQSGGFFFSDASGIVSTPVMENESAWACYEHLSQTIALNQE